MLEPSKEDLERARGVALELNMCCSNPIAFAPECQCLDCVLRENTAQVVAQALAELRAEGERKYQSVKDEYVCELNKTQNEWEAEKSALEERVRELTTEKGMDRFYHADGTYETLPYLQVVQMRKDAAKELTRLKVRNEELEKKLEYFQSFADQNHTLAEKVTLENENLKAENERLRDFSKSYDVTENSVYQEAKKEISRLTASLAAAQESLRKIYEMPFSSGCGDEQRIAQEALSDKDGTLAFERWKAMLEEVNEARTILNLLGFHDWPKKKEIDDYLEKWKKMGAVVEAARACYEEDDFITENSPGSFERDKKLGEALEALDAKGASDV